MQKAWKEQQASKEQTGIVDADVIAETVSKMTGIPLTRLEKAEAERLLAMEGELGQGRHPPGRRDQGHRARCAVRVRASRTRAVPMGSFVFLGPSGVGKTYLCKQLAKFMFGSEDAVITMDMSEYMEKHNASRLVGAPPGYVGYEEGGQLTEKVRRRPYSVVLLDEIEKAHPDVFNMLLQIMEEGRLTDSFGRHVDFKNVILIMTSEPGLARDEGGRLAGLRQGRHQAQVGRDPRRSKRMKRRRDDRGRAPLPARVPEPRRRAVIFNPLSSDDLRRIVDLQLDEVHKRLKERGS
jgi:ATP-dependent Clp protease ATP-binding subunit ClpC